MACKRARIDIQTLDDVVHTARLSFDTPVHWPLHMRAPIPPVSASDSGALCRAAQATLHTRCMMVLSPVKSLRGEVYTHPTPECFDRPSFH
jgi:hypothetical protein